MNKYSPRKEREAEHRHAWLRKWVAQESCRSQQELVRAARKAGFSVQQATISRDLRALNVTKVKGRYRILSLGAVPSPLHSIRRITEAGAHLLVLHTDPGAAPLVAVHIDRMRWQEVTGTVAGDDTIFIAVTSSQNQRKLARKLRPR
jgi:transcriptional regulator of arginine metabolism